MSAENSRLSAAAVTLRTMVAADIPFAHELRALAGWNQTEKDWQGYLRFAPDGCLVAELNGHRAGTATTIRYGDRFGWIGMVLVHPDFRRLGIGSRLLREAIASLQRSGVRSVRLDATAMGRPVYVPLGFVDEYGLIRWEGNAPDLGVGPVEEVARLTSADMPALAPFDEAVFGADRSATLSELVTRNPSWCFVVRGAKGISGYLIAREGARAVQVGPWIAHDGATAERLFRGLLRHVVGRLVFVDVLAPNATGEELMQRYGFRVQRTLTRMYLGEIPERGQPELIYSINGAEKG